ncbi:alpha/beta fold hydrolase [Umboniibacter marinipuniceus]|uniref:Pimeloyl-ACP methyl ester carboxylesterase n=1 Tax=Umboniibacter marinipuniceus TaxID=569599 RepID=A0A3M0AFR5_9GAMM|nr:alpha/beta hydrolase [Umboniibacter marinipuniceus]RMA82429.1 pimeloyl-ACP methyl ester carboxylesterase [Umboniibacter marinipuniceus]
MTRENILFIPGSLCDERLFAPQLAAFQDRYHCTVAEHSPEDISISAMAQRALRSVTGDFHLVGLSMGAIISFEILRVAPERVRSLVIMDGNPQAEKPERMGLRAQQRQLAIQGGEEFLEAFLLNELFPLYVARDNVMNSTIKACVLAMAMDSGVEAFDAQWQALETRPDSLASLPQIRVPTLVLCGAEDALCSPALHQQMATVIPNSTLGVVPSAGHLVTLEAPLIVNKYLEELWKQKS